MTRRIGLAVSLAVTVVVGFAIWSNSSYRLPGNQQGYEPKQPIAFSHRIHAGVNGISCLYCHSSVEKSRVAGLPSASTCMNCHSKVIPDTPEVRKVAMALQSNRPIEWVSIHRLPAFATFNHSAHVNAGFACSQCHGPVETMERVRQEQHLSMGFCVNCHRTWENAPPPADSVVWAGGGRAPLHRLAPSTDCSVCHQ